MDAQEVEDRLNKLILEVEEIEKSKVPVLRDNLVLLLRVANLSLTEKEKGYGYQYKSGIRIVCEDLINELERGKFIKIK